ncbi:hypothetical protein NJC38_21910 [Pseudomonas sp. 21LCFQ010]|uniref:hypothetical protein n=1 Tax=Pseudomonas sp. 21LCFQ010 TaxID=2957506 RepID=UPI0020978EBB|nr:hypothetical protein [Pseudomonas sp. 21LCFQ010]MCO8164797.1 hypothetical protein [Pseudomonas sp. 21LCFQ010]
MPSIDIDDKEVIDCIHMVIENARRNIMKYSNDKARHDMERSFVLGYIEGLLKHGLLSRDVAYDLVEKLKSS